MQMSRNPWKLWTYLPFHASLAGKIVAIVPVICANHDDFSFVKMSVTSLTS